MRTVFVSAVIDIAVVRRPSSRAERRDLPRRRRASSPARAIT
jgi:hypothetical protein